MKAKTTRRAMSKMKKDLKESIAMYEMVWHLIDEHFDKGPRAAAHEWLMKVAASHDAILELEIELSNAPRRRARALSGV